MRQLGEMVVEEPVAGSFSHFAYKYWGDFAGFLSGWNYWAMFILVGMAELTAVGIYIQYWWPGSPRASAALFFVLINLINLVNVRLYGETEFWFAIIKVVAIVGMIVFGAAVGQRQRRAAGQHHQSVAAGRFYAARPLWVGDGDGGDHVLVRRVGNGRHHCGGSRRSASQHS